MSSAKCISIHLFCKHSFTAPFPSEGKPLQPIISFISSPFFHSGLCDSAAFSGVIKRGIPVDRTVPLIFKMTLYFQSFFFFSLYFVAVCVFARCQSLHVGQGHSLSCPQWNSGIYSTVATQKCVWLIHQIASNVHYYVVVNKHFELSVWSPFN